MDRMLDEDEDDPATWARRRYQEVYAEFEARHPTQLRANKFIDGLFQASRIRGYSSRLDREAARSGDDLHVAYHQLSDVFGAAPPELREHLFRLLQRVMMACHALGQHAAPEGRSAHEARKGSGDHMFAQLTATVGIYLEAHPELVPPKATSDYANAIRPAILELLNLSKDAKRPSTSAIRRAILGGEARDSGNSKSALQS